MNPISMLLAMGTGVLIVFFLFVILMVIGMWKVFSKAGQPGWASIIPIYREITILNVAKKPLWWIVLLIIPFVNFIVIIILCVEISKNFGKGAGLGVGMALVPFICWPVLGFSKTAVYQPVTAEG